MESRMEKYYKEDLSEFNRIKKNEKLYKDISSEISELDNLPIPDNSNEIDINGLREIVSSRDEYRKAKELGRTVTLPKREVTNAAPKESSRIYDINVLLENAKNEINKNAEANKEEPKINTNFLTNLEDANIPYVPEADDAMELSEEVPKEDKDKKESNTNSLPLDILVDLKGDDNTVVTDPIVKEEVTMIKKIKEGETFYSGSFNFSKKDFDEDDDDEKLFEEKLYLVQSEHPTVEKPIVHTDELDPTKELFLSWDDNFQIWHDRWLSSVSRPHISADTITLLDRLWKNADTWMIAPESVIHELSRYRKIYVSELKNPAPNRICYKIKHKYPKTTSKRAVELFEEILEQLLHLERKEIPIGEIWGGQ